MTPGAPPPRLLVVGHVTRDLFGAEERLGGAAAFAARAAAHLGLPTGVVTAAPPEHPLLEPLRRLPGVGLQCRPSAAMTTFALEYEGGRRRLVQRRTASPLAPADVPPQWRGATVAYVAPVAGECDRALVDALGARLVVAGLQGWLRRPAPDGTVEPACADEIRDPPRALGAAVLSEEDHPDAEAIALDLASRGITVALTRGAAGATVYTPRARWTVAAAPAREAEPTGAGDVFGLCFALGLGGGVGPQRAAEAAAEAAARVVEGPGLGRFCTLEPLALRRRLGHDDL